MNGLTQAVRLHPRPAVPLPRPVEVVAQETSHRQGDETQQGSRYLRPRAYVGHVEGLSYLVREDMLDRMVEALLDEYLGGETRAHEADEAQEADDDEEAHEYRDGPPHYRGRLVHVVSVFLHLVDVLALLVEEGLAYEPDAVGERHCRAYHAHR